jgi:cyclase
MKSNLREKWMGRREMLRNVGALTGGALAVQFFPGHLIGAASWGLAQQAPSSADPLAAARAQFAQAPIKTTQLAENLTLLSGPGGNVVVLNGMDGKLVVDTFVMPAWQQFKTVLETFGKAPVNIVIDTHWHFDHADNNAALHDAGATIVAHENTKKRMSQSNTLPVINIPCPASPANALPQQTFQGAHRIAMNRENLSLVYIPPAHTDSDIYIHFEKANVLHCGDVFFNGTYPYIDSGTGGSVSGTIAGLTKLLAVADNNTKIVPGHGPLGNKSDVMKFREMLSTVRERLQKLKSAGKTAEEAAAAKPLADLNATWAGGLNDGDEFVKIAYRAL